MHGQLVCPRPQDADVPAEAGAAAGPVDRPGDAEGDAVPRLGVGDGVAQVAGEVRPLTAAGGVGVGEPVHHEVREEGPSLQGFQEQTRPWGACFCRYEEKKTHDSGKRNWHNIKLIVLRSQLGAHPRWGGGG